MKKLMFAAALACAPCPAFAASTLVGEVNGWSVYDERGSCAASTLYEGDVFVRVEYDFGRDSAFFTVTNPAWESVKKGERYKVLLRFNNGEEWPDTSALGVRADGPEVRLTGLQMHLDGDDFLPDFAGAGALSITLGDTRLAILSLKGTRLVAQRLSSCAIASFKRYPPDPFKSLPGSDSGETRASAGPQPITSLPLLFSDEDYPAAALRAGEQGRTGFRLAIAANGRVSGCTVTASSGSAALDSATCRLIASRARFRPALDPVGRPAEGNFDGGIVWSLPADPAPPTARPGDPARGD